MAVFGDLNEAQVLGNITQDIEVRYTSNGSAVTNFSVATNRSYRKQGSEEWEEEVSFHNIVVWGNDAEYLSQKASKGTRIFVKGRLQTRSWDDQEGKKNYRTEIIAERIILIDRYERGPADPSKTQAHKDSSTSTIKSQETKQSDDEIDPDDLPF